MLFPERRIILRRNSTDPIPLSTYLVYEARCGAASAHVTTRLADLLIWSSHSTQDIDSFKADPQKEPLSSKLFGERMGGKKKQRQTRCCRLVTNAAEPDTVG